MNLRTALKRINLFSQGQRLIVIVSVLVSLFAMAILYYTPAPLLLIPVIFVINYLLFRRILVTKKIRTITTKSLRPFLWLLFSLFYFFTVYVISQTIPIVFMACMVFSALVYGILCYLETQPEPKVVLDNFLTLLFILVSASFASLLITYWHWPVALVMLLIWLLSFLVALWWLLGFTNNPQILAALWGFVVLEITWLTSRWIVLYQIPKVPLIISQLAIMLTALAYGWGGIYYHYKHRNLKRSIVFEYLLVTILVFIALLVLNRWTSTG